jgi:hypothetical protein
MTEAFAPRAVVGGTSVTSGTGCDDEPSGDGANTYSGPGRVDLAAG